MKNTDLVQLLRELAQNVKSLRGDLSTFTELNDDYFDRTEAMISRARQAAEEIEGREAGPGLDDVIDQAWRSHQTIGCQGERLMYVMYEQGFDRAGRLVIARFGGGEAGSTPPTTT